MYVFYVNGKFRNVRSFTFYTVHSHFSLIFPCFLACNVRCGAFIQCGGDSATDLLAVWYRARANWIGPEPDSVLRSVRSLVHFVGDLIPSRSYEFYCDDITVTSFINIRCDNVAVEIIPQEQPSVIRLSK